MSTLTPQPTTLAPTHAARVFAALEARHSPNTLRAYRAAWNAWAAWADAYGVEPLPAAPGWVASYLSERAQTHSMATIRMAAAAIAAAHRQTDNPNPIATSLVSGTLKGLRRQAAEAGRMQAKQAGALTDEALAAIRKTACEPRIDARGRHESDERARQRGLVDVALCQTMSDAGLRRSEAAALKWAHVGRERDGSGRLLIARSKTDQSGLGMIVAVTRRGMKDLQAIRGGAGDDASVFGLSASSIDRRIKAAARAAGLGNGFGGHSGRVGLARRMIAKEAPLTVVMQQGRWRSSGMVARYTRGESAGAALKYL